MHGPTRNRCMTHFSSISVVWNSLIILKPRLESQLMAGMPSTDWCFELLNVILIPAKMSHWLYRSDEGMHDAVSLIYLIGDCSYVCQSFKCLKACLSLIWSVQSRKSYKYKIYGQHITRNLQSLGPRKLTLQSSVIKNGKISTNLLKL